MRAQASLEEKMIRDLLRRKRAYEKHFRSKSSDDEPGNQAHSAYISIIKAIVDIARKAERQAGDPEEFRRIALEILRNDYGIER